MNTQHKCFYEYVCCIFDVAAMRYHCTNACPTVQWKGPTHSLEYRPPARLKTSLDKSLSGGGREKQKGTPSRKLTAFAKMATDRPLVYVHI